MSHIPNITVDFGPIQMTAIQQTTKLNIAKTYFSVKIGFIVLEYHYVNFLMLC